MKKIILVLFLVAILCAGCSSNTNSNSKLLHGKLLDIKENCKKINESDKTKCLEKVAIIKAKIESSYSNKATIDQNYFNIENFIKTNNENKYQEIQYWAVADMKNGDESKVISFTLNENTIKQIYNNKIAATQIGDYADDLWILESLKQ